MQEYSTTMQTKPSHGFNRRLAASAGATLGPWGEIEAWGSGVQRIFEAFRAAGAPEPLLRYEPNDLWLEFPFSATYLTALGGASAATAHDAEQVARLLALLKDGLPAYAVPELLITGFFA